MLPENAQVNQNPQFQPQPGIVRSNTPPTYTRSLGSTRSNTSSLFITLLLIILAIALCGGAIYLFGGRLGPFESVTLTAPTLQPLPQFTNQTAIIINGTTSNNADVIFYVNGVETVTARADNSGEFVGQFTIEEEKRYLINAVTLQQNIVRYRSTYSNTVETIFDKTAPLITVNKLTDQTIGNRYSITGRVSEKAKISVDLRGNLAEANSNLDGTFTVAVSLTPGGNNYSIYATDLAGNKGSIEKGLVSYTIPSIGGGTSVKPSKLPNSAGELAKSTQAEFITVLLGIFAVVGLLGYNAFSSVLWIVQKHTPNRED